MTCKDCYHYDVCHRRINSIDFLPVIKGKKKRKLKAVTNGEFCRKWKEIHTFCRIGEVECPFFGVVDCRPRDFKAKPFQTKDGKYILIEVKE